MASRTITHYGLSAPAAISFWMGALLSFLYLAGVAVIILVSIFTVGLNASQVPALVLATLFGGFVGYLTFNMPIRITLDEEEGMVVVRSFARSSAVHAAEIIAIHRPAMRLILPSYLRSADVVVLQSHAGQVVLQLAFRDIDDFISRVRALNPGIEVTGV